jgi:vacuolar protein sorting-associated protein VTA1
MALAVPPQLKTPEISRFLQRASQLEKVKPIIAYWCTTDVLNTTNMTNNSKGNYNVVNLILNKGLHTESEECMTYTTTLMDKLEQFKAENVGNDAIHDDMGAQAYVEQFATDTFQRADKALRAKRATKITAETFHAAGTFLDLLGIWQNPLNQEVAAKSKYSKYHAMRILKALKAGEDPNLSTEVEDLVATPPALDPNDPEVQRIRLLQPKVEDYPEDGPSPMHEDTSPQFIDQPPAINSPYHTQPSASQPFAPSNQTGGDVSPLEPEQSNNDYFPQVPTFTAEASPNIATAPTEDRMQTSPALHPVSAVDPQNFYQTAPPPNTAPTPYIPPQFPPQQAAPRFQPPPTIAQPRLEPSPSVPMAHTINHMQGNLVTDDEAITQAQKHAKWAISALNFDDVPTAVRELQNALSVLGAR